MQSQQQENTLPSLFDDFKCKSINNSTNHIDLINSSFEYIDELLYWEELEFDTETCYTMFTNTKMRHQLCGKPTEIQSPLPKATLLASILRLNDFKIAQTLGRGSFGTVYEAEVFERKVALKLIHHTYNKEHEQQINNSYTAEHNLKGLKHKNLVQFIGSNDNLKFIIYEFGGKLNLSQLIMDTNIELSMKRRHSFSLDLVSALEYIHSKQIVHMDLKPSNIIVTEQYVCKLSDFGCSIKLEQSNIFDYKNNNVNNNNQTTPNSKLKQQQQQQQQYSDSRWTAGTWFYRAPELFRNNSKSNSNAVSTACDIYSLAICMWQLLTRDSPYNGENPHVIVYQIVSKDLRPQFPSEYNSCQTNNSDPQPVRSYQITSFERIYRLIVEKCWDSDPRKRYSAKQIRQLLIDIL